MAPPARPPLRDAPIPPLAGYTVLVASDQRRDPVAGLLEQVGARTVGIQAARSLGKPPEAALRAATEQCLSQPCHDVVVSSAVGLRTWLAAAQRWGLARALVQTFAGARLLARDDAAADALRALGLRDILSTDGQTSEGLLRYLLSQQLRGRRIVAQTNRQSLAAPCAALRAGGAEVVEVATYTLAAPVESYSLRRLCDLVIRRQVDAVVLVGAGVAAQVWAHAERDNRHRPLVHALANDIPCLSLGALPEAPVRPQVAPQPFAEELADTVLAVVPARARHITAAGHRLELRGHAIVLDGRLLPVQPGPMAVLRTLADRPGKVLSAAQIRAALHYRDVDDHAVEMAVSRLRQATPGTNLIQTIVKHGYTLAP